MGMITPPTCCSYCWLQMLGVGGYGIATFDIPTPQGVASPSFRLLNCTRFCMHLQGPPALQLPSQNGQTILTHSWLTLTVYEALRGSTTTPPSSSSRLYTFEGTIRKPSPHTTARTHFQSTSTRPLTCAYYPWNPTHYPVMHTRPHPHNNCVLRLCQRSSSSTTHTHLQPNHKFPYIQVPNTFSNQIAYLHVQILMHKAPVCVDGLKDVASILLYLFIDLLEQIITTSQPTFMSIVEYSNETHWTLPRSEKDVHSKFSLPIRMEPCGPR